MIFLLLGHMSGHIVFRVHIKIKDTYIKNFDLVTYSIETRRDYINDLYD